MQRARAFVDQSEVSYPSSFEHASQLTCQRSGGVVRLTASDSFENTLNRSLGRITGIISSKLDQFFELSEYDWTPKTRETGPSVYLYELVNWLTTVVDSLAIKESYKDEAYKGALGYIADCLMVRLRPPCRRRVTETRVLKELLCWARYPHDERKRSVQYSHRR
jgi:Exocyst complex subunit Sec15-like